MDDGYVLIHFLSCDCDVSVYVQTIHSIEMVDVSVYVQMIHSTEMEFFFL